MQPALTVTALVMALLNGPPARAAVRGRALLLDAPSRVKPGNLVLCTLKGDERAFRTLVEGDVIDAHFSPDGKGVVYGVGGTIKVMDLAAGTTRDVGPYTAPFTYFNWTRDNKIYWSDGPDLREIYSIDLETKAKKAVHKGNRGRSTVSVDGTRAAWVLPPVCAFIGGKQYRIQGGCGGAVSPSGRYLTSNLTTSHRLIGIFTFGEAGPSASPVRTVAGARGYGINGFSFGRSDAWVCYVVEHPKQASPTSFICYWRTADHIQVAETGTYCIKDFFDETDVLPADAALQKITVCAPGPTNTPLSHELVNVGASRPLKVVGHYTGKDGPFTPQVRGGITWKADSGRVALTDSALTGVAETGRMTVTAEYQGKRASFEVTVLPKLTGDGFKAEFFSDATWTTPVLTRVDPYIDFRWGGRASPDPSINGRKPWSARWTGTLDVQVEGEYTFSFLQGEGNDGWLRQDRKWATDKDGNKIPSYGVWVDGNLIISRTKDWNYPWATPKASKPITLTKGPHAVRVTTIDQSAHPVVAQLYWSGPGIEMSLLGGGHVHSGASGKGKGGR